MSKLNVDAVRNGILGCEFRRRAGTGLLFGADEAKLIRERAATREGMLADLEKKCREIVQLSPQAVEQHTARSHAVEAETVATGYFFGQEAAHAEWVKRRVEALLELDTWLYPAHSEFCVHTDHVMTNVGSFIARAHDMLGEAYSDSETKHVAEGLRRMLLLPYLQSVPDRVEWWSAIDHESNWKIMCHGETGLTVCEFAEHLPEARDALACAAVGVLEILDMVPPEGDWAEGVNYWLATLYMGLRYATALRRLTGGAVDLYEHPALKVTGDFMMMLTTPGSRFFNFNDNHDHPHPMHSEGLALLAKDLEREDWMYIARLFPVDTPLYLAWAYTDLPSRKPEPTTALFPRSGVATLRSGWDEADTFVGVKCGQSDVPHSHLDAGTFVIESGRRWLVKDEGYWRYAHSLGFFDDERYRWNWDNLAAVGHNTLLIDGRGQSFGKDYPGRIRSLESGTGWDMVVADASKTYPGLLRKFVRTVLFLRPDTIVIRDVVECEGERHAEWLLHYAGTVRSEGLVSVVENDGVWLTVVPFLPDRSFGWRTADVRSASTYLEESTRQDVTESIAYRSFSPFRRSEKFEFLFGLRVNGRPDGQDWQFRTTDAGWTLKAEGHDHSVGPRGDVLESSPTGAE